MNAKPPANQTIAERAYCLWEQAGQPTGREEEFWLRAEAELEAPASTSKVPPVIPPPLPSVAAVPAHQIPPPIKDAVKATARRRGPKRT